MTLNPLEQTFLVLAIISAIIAGVTHWHTHRRRR